MRCVELSQRTTIYEDDSEWALCLFTTGIRKGLRYVCDIQWIQENTHIASHTYWNECSAFYAVCVRLYGVNADPNDNMQKHTIRWIECSKVRKDIECVLRVHQSTIGLCGCTLLKVYIMWRHFFFNRDTKVKLELFRTIVILTLRYWVLVTFTLYSTKCQSFIEVSCRIVY